MSDLPRPGADATAPLTLRTLGEAGLYAAAGGEPLLGPGKPLALLVHLALTPGRRISREFLLDLLWADVDPDRARNALRQALFQLRRLLGPDALPGTEELALARPIETDRDRFLAAIERGELESAVQAYGGAFLPAFGVPGGVRFEQWADLERDRLRAAFVRSAELLVRRLLNQSRFRDAQRLARRVRDEAPDAESAWRLLLKTIIAGRDFVSAAVEAEALQHWAESEALALEPATRLAIARARQITPLSDEATDDVALVAELTGREREFAAITAAWENVRTGPARHLHIAAPAGIGKTRLLRDAVARLRAGGATVVEVRGAPGDRDVPFAFAADLAMVIAPLRGAAGIAPASASALIALNPALSSYLTGQPDAATGEDALRRRIHALADLVHAVADEQPFVLAIDDAHWIDDASYRMLEGLCGRLNGAHVLCLTAARPERVPAGDTVTILGLAALTPSQVSDFVLTLGSIPDGAPWGRDFVMGLHEATRGSPLLILETLRLAIDEDILELDKGEWRCLDIARLASLVRAGEALRQRVRALPAQQKWVLGLLAVAGTPLPLEPLATAVGCPTSELADTLASLERQGLATRAGALWLTAHDEIAAAAREALEPGQQRAAERAIGELVIGRAGTDPYSLLRGIRHLVASGDDNPVAQHFRRYAQRSRELHDRRPFRVLAGEVLGEDVASPRVASLVAALPIPWRLGLWSRARQAMAAAFVVLVAAGAAAIGLLRGREDATMQRLVYVDNARVASAIPARARDWDGRNGPLMPVRATTQLVDAALAFPERAPAVSPDARSVAWNQDSGDSTTLDIWLRTPAGVRRLTHQARDDLVIGWLPDGSALVGLTNRWSSPADGDYDVAVFDTATGDARQVTGGPDHDQSPFVSPDGTRIAFIRESNDGPHRLCVTALDGIDTPACRLVGGQPLAQLLGWSGPVELIVTLDSAGARPLIRYDWSRDERALLLGPHVYRGQLSPDRRWVVAAVRLEGMRGFRDWIVPVDEPARARHVEASTAWAERVRWWEGAPDASGLIDRIEFTDSARTIQPGTGTRLGIRALTRMGTEIPLHAPVRWVSSDTLVATVDPTGVVHPRATGAVTIEASLAGWRTRITRLEVRGEPAVTVLDERWDDAWRDRWIAFGDPQPDVTSGPRGIRAFWNRGDGTYYSMAVLREAYSARQGLGAEVRLSTPVTRADWQRARTTLVADIDTAALQRADQRAAPPSTGRIDASCGAGYPATAGAYGERRIALIGGVSPLIELESDAIGSGEWWTLRLQILPDGRCGIAIDNHVIWISPEPIPLDGEFRLRLGDESAGTKLLHGPLQIWTGVRTDIDWSRPPASSPSGREPFFR